MNQHMVVDAIHNLPRGNDFADRIQTTIRQTEQTGKPFFVIVLQLANMDEYMRRHPRYVVLNLYKELYNLLRGMIHPSQFIGSFQNGFGFVFDSIQAGQVDNISRRLAAVTTRVIREGRYNDVASRWSDILQQFLMPNRPSFLYPRLGWAIFPRDGMNSTQIVKRALCHLEELNR